MVIWKLIFLENPRVIEIVYSFSSPLYTTTIISILVKYQARESSFMRLYCFVQYTMLYYFIENIFKNSYKTWVKFKEERHREFLHANLIFIIWWHFHATRSRNLPVFQKNQWVSAPREENDKKKYLNYY